jgi:Zn-dependent M16 (insulinase) family peptidase
MSEYEDDDRQDSSPKALRDALEKANKEKAEFQKQLDEMKTQLNKRSLNDALREKGVPASLQKWMEKDNVTADNVDKWLEENGSDFGWKAGGDERPEGQQSDAKEVPAPQSVLSAEDIAAIARVQALTGQSTSPVIPSDQAKAAVDTVAAGINLNTDYNSVVKALQASGIPIEGSLNFG